MSNPFSSVEKKVSDAISAAEKSLTDNLDFTKVIVFIRSVTVEGVKNVDFFSKNDLYFSLEFEQAAAGLPSNPFNYKSAVKQEAGDRAHWDIMSQIHIDTHIVNLRTKQLSLRLLDKNSIFSDVNLGESKISFKNLIDNGYDVEVAVPFGLLKDGKSNGKGTMNVYLSAPFNWITCGLHEPKCMVNLFKIDKPSLFNCFGCFYPHTCGTFSLPNGEKFCSCHAPECLSCSRPSLATLGGLIHGPTCGTCAAFDEGCGSMGFPTLSVRCCSNDIHVLPCLSNGCEVLEEAVGLPTFFGKGVVVVSEVKVLFMLHEAVEKIDPPPPTSQKAVNLPKNDKVENTLEVVGIPEALNHKYFFFEIEYVSKSTDFKFKSDPEKGGHWLFSPGKIHFGDDSRGLHQTKVRIKLYEKKALGLENELIGEGETSLELMLHSHFNNPVDIGVSIRKKVKMGEFLVNSIVSKVSLRVTLYENAPDPNSGPSPSGRKRRESILFEMKPETITLTNEHFLEIPELHIPKDISASIVTSSIDKEEDIVGYQVEMFSRTDGKSKGVWVICGLKKFRFSSTSYMIKNQLGHEKWVVFQKDKTVSGRPFTLRRKVISF